MTIQIPEKIIYKDKESLLYSEPMRSFFRKRKNLPKFKFISTRLWRCYIATWKIENNKLWLSNIEGILNNGEAASIKAFFPDSAEMVFASWFTGVLNLPQGKPILCKTIYGTAHEKSLLIFVKNGQVQLEKIIDNHDNLHPASMDEDVEDLDI